jgi:uncharacterized protein
MNEQRFVLDTNVIVSAALLENSVARRAFDKAILHGQILISDDLQDELSEAILRPKFDRYLSTDKRLQFLARFINLAMPISVVEQIDICRDPKDNMILELAVDGKANCIVSGDKDLLVLNPFRGIAIMPPRAFWEEYALDSE